MLAAKQFSHGEEPGDGFVAQLGFGDKVETLVLFRSKEVGNDRYKYLEAVVDVSDGVALEARQYFFEVAGMEFANPNVLIAVGVALAYPITAAVAAIYRLGRGLRRERQD